MKSIIRLTLWSVIIAVIAMIVWNPWDNPIDNAPIWTQEFSNMKADLVLNKIKYRRDEKGKKKWTIIADQAKMFEANQKIVFDKPVIYFFNNKNGQVIASAKSGVYMISSEIIDLKGRVVIRTSDASSLHSELLHFKQKDMVVDTEKAVHINRKDGLTIDGKGLKYNISTGKLTIFHSTAIIPEHRDGELL